MQTKASHNILLLSTMLLSREQPNGKIRRRMVLLTTESKCQNTLSEAKQCPRILDKQPDEKARAGKVASTGSQHMHLQHEPKPKN